MGGRFQSALQDANSRLKGSVVLEIAAYDADAVSTLAGSTAGTDAISWVNVGSVSGVNMTENIPTSQLQGDNALEEKTASDQTVTLAFNQREALSEDAREVLRGSFDTSGTPVAGAEVEDAEQVIASGAWGYNDPIVIENQNYDLSAVTVVSLAGSTNASLVADTDYFVGQDALGRTVITIIDSTTITTLSQSMTITYDYTPYASQTTYTGGKTTLPYLMARLSNTDEDDYLYRVWLYRGSIDSGYSFAFKSDIDSDPVVPNAVSITFICDQSLDTGYQLMKDYKERGI